MSRRLVGTIDLADLDALCQLRGAEFLPYPLLREGVPVETGAGAPSVAARFDGGELQVFRDWIETHEHADVWVECRVLYRDDDTPDTRLSACRSAGLGFLAAQRPGQDLVDVFELSPPDIAAAIAQGVRPSGPGSHPQVVIPKYVNYFRGSAAESAGFDDFDDDYEVTIRADRPGVEQATVVRDADVLALATIQSHCEPARAWGVDWAKDFLVWVQLDADGDYIYDAEFQHAVPATYETLRSRIDRLVEVDLAESRRRGTR
ncbi:ESX secretion-associated protein EspG [Mycobacterium asiaticum]|uniref:ESX secretion-associated protein EspG n=1 Tax=Mycobacterium asiaticum TaxID=1790 RepID=UPI0007EF34A1|nr:ESX secretion-associated protein EspG [Mycobacterium asiaticum]OBJ63130.1 hypothetical protein A9W94_00800 [Mycobacterium asiaticum]